MNKTLYLAEKEDVSITRDGPSVWVKEDGKAGRRIPARFLDKVIVFGNVRIDTEIITLFAAHNVPMVFMDKRGSEAAVAMPRNDHFVNHYDEQKFILATEKNIKAYCSWLDKQRKAVQLAAVRRLSKNVASSYEKEGFDEHDYQSFVTRSAWKNEKQWTVVDKIITGMSFGTALRCVIDAGLDPHVGVANRRCNYGLAMDICSIIDAEFDIQTIEFFKNNGSGQRMVKTYGNWQVTREGMRDIVMRYEGRKQATLELIGRAIDSFFEFMRELRS